MKLTDLKKIERKKESSVDSEVFYAVEQIKDAYRCGNSSVFINEHALSDFASDEIRRLGYQCFWNRACQWWEVSGW